MIFAPCNYPHDWLLRGAIAVITALNSPDKIAIECRNRTIECSTQAVRGMGLE